MEELKRERASIPAIVTLLQVNRFEWVCKPAGLLLLLAHLAGWFSIPVFLIPGFSRSSPPYSPEAGVYATATPFQPISWTRTPYRPVEPTAPALPMFAPTSTPAPTVAPPVTPLPAPNYTDQPFLWNGIDMSDTGRRIRVSIIPQNGGLNQGRPVEVSFRPGRPCEWADRRACVSVHYGGRIILATVHSGVLGDGQALRHAIEGTWLNAAALPLDQVLANLEALTGLTVSVEQEGESSTAALAAAAVRIPARELENYFSIPVDEALELAGQYNPEFAKTLASSAGLPPGQKLLMIETCGWRHLEEPWAEGVTGTSGSVYLVAIR